MGQAKKRVHWQVRWRLCDEDRDAYGGPEWVTFDSEALRAVPGKQLMAIEATVHPLRITDFWQPYMRDTTIGKMAMVWIARRQAGLVDDWDEFDPRIELATYEVTVVDDADPPADGASQTSSEAAP